MRQFGDGMAHRLVQAARQIAALDVGDGDAHVVGRDAGGEYLAPVTDHQQDIGRQIGQHIDRSLQTQAHGAGAFLVAVAGLFHIDGGGDGKLILHLPHRAAKLVIEMLVGDHQGQLQRLMGLNGAHGRGQGAEAAALARPNTDFFALHARSSICNRVSAATPRANVRPTISCNRLAGMPLPGRLVIKSPSPRTVPAVRSRRATTDLVAQT